MSETDEEFSNFLFKVNQVSEIVKKLACNDKNLQEIGDLEAKHYLGEEKLDFVGDDDVNLTICNDRTQINAKALIDNDPATQSQEAFMEEISKDADRRYKDKMRRRERMETFKKQAALAFKRGEFEKALTRYDKAIEQIKDSVILYQNRALTHLKLNCCEKAVDDLKWALRLNEDSLKTWLLLAKAHYLQQNTEEFNRAIEEATRRNSHHKAFINDYVEKLSLD